MTATSLAGLAAFIIASAAATLPGSSFNTTNGDLTDLALHDWNPAGAPVGNVGPLQTITCPSSPPGAGTNCGLDRTGSALDDSFAQGPKEDDPAPSVGTGSIPPNKDDLSRFYVNQEKAGGNDYLYLAWERTNTLGSAHMDFEFNQSSTLSANGVTKVRTAGDMLITFDFGGSGVPALSLSKWVTSGPASQCEASNNLPCWSALQTLGAFADASVNNHDVTDNNPPASPRTLPGSVSSNGTVSSTFGEAGINLTAAGVFPPNVCAHFGAASLKSRSSGSSFTSTLKDFIAPIPVNISNCGGLEVQKYIDINENASQDSGERALTGTGGNVVDDDLHNWSFTITGPNSFTCTGTTDASGVLTACVKPDNTNADLAALPGGTYTVTENANASKTIGSNSSPFFNTDPGPAPKTPPVTNTATVTIDATTTVAFGNSCFATANFAVTGVPTGQSGLFVRYTVNDSATSKDVDLTQNGSTWTGSDGGLRRGDVIHWSFGINNDATHLVVGPDFTLSGYPNCAGSGTREFPTTTINSLKYKDINANGAKDGGEGGLQGFQFQLKHGSDTIDTQRSDANGAIQFTGVAPGTYTIHEVGPPAGWTQTEPANNGDVTVTVDLGAPSVTAGAFGDTPLSNIDVAFHSVAHLLNADGSNDGPATKATSIACSDANGDVGSSTNSNTNTTNDLKLNQSSVTCVITFTDP
ncbi:MAG TPA: SpaA isopeptide-forming pilin-related protein [Thermoleophilaceae bacterium]